VKIIRVESCRGCPNRSDIRVIGDELVVTTCKAFPLKERLAIIDLDVVQPWCPLEDEKEAGDDRR